MSDRDYPIKINSSLQATPLQTPGLGQPKMDTEDSIVFDAAVDCVICFDPKDVLEVTYVFVRGSMAVIPHRKSAFRTPLASKFSPRVSTAKTI